MKYSPSFFWFAIGLFLSINASGWTQEESGVNLGKSDNEIIDEFLKELPAESTWSSWLLANGPIYGNYCGAEHGDLKFEAPCLNRLDCICKSYDLAQSLKHYREADRGYINQQFKTSQPLSDLGPEYDKFLATLTTKLFAAQLKGKDIVAKAKLANETFRRDPNKALSMAEELVDEKPVFRGKIEEINRERSRFDQQSSEQTKEERTYRLMALSTQPFNLIAGLFSLNYEYRLSRILSLRLGTSFLGAGLITDTYLGYGNNKDFSAFLSLGLKGFISGETLRDGVYLEPFVDLGYENVANRARPDLANIRDFALVPAGLVGVEKVFASGIQIDIGVGIGTHFGIPISDVPSDYKTIFVVPKFRASLGYAW